MELHEDVHVDKNFPDNVDETRTEGAKVVGFEGDKMGISMNDDEDERQIVEGAWKATWTCGS